MKVQSGPPVQGPSSSIGIMRFFDSDSGGPKLDPRAVMVASALFAVLILCLQLFA